MKPATVVERLSQAVLETSAFSDPAVSGRSLPALAALLALSAWLCLHGLAAKALWNDEAFSFFVAWQGPAAALHMIGGDAQPPFYYLLLSLWLHLGHDTVTLRSLSALAMILAVVPVYDGIRRLLGNRAALLTALLFVVNPYAVAWAHIARPYAVQTLLVAVCFWGFARVWTAPEAAENLIGQGLAGLFGRRAAAVDLAWIVYAVAGGLAMLTQYPAGFFVLGCNGAVAWRILADRRRNRRLLLNWSLAQLLLIGVWLIWLPEMLVQFGAHMTPETIAAQHTNYLIGTGDFGDILVRVFGISYLWRAHLPFLILYVVLAAAGIVHLIRSGRGLPAIVLALVPPAVCTAGFLLLHPLFGYVVYTFVWILPFYLALIATGMLLFRPVILAALLGLALLGNAWGVANYNATAAVPLDKIAGLIVAQMQPGDGIVLSESTAARWGLAYYLGPERWAALPGLGASGSGTDRLIRSPEQARAFRRLWVVVPEEETSAVDLPTLHQETTLVSETRLGNIRVLCLAR